MNEGNQIDLKRILYIVSSKKVFIIFVMILFVLLGYFYSFNYVTPKYDSETTLILVADESEETKQLNQNDITLNNNLVTTYSNIVKSNKILNKVINNLNLQMTEKELAGNIKISNIEKTQIIKITVSNANPTLARDISNEVKDVFIQEISEIYNMKNISVVDQPQVAVAPSNVNHSKDIIMFLAAGFMACGAYVVLLYLVDNTIKDEDDITHNIGLKVMGFIPVTQKKEEELILKSDVKSYISECFRTIRTNISYTQVDKTKKSILVTSTLSGDGKSMISSNLALSFAMANKNVLLIDCDMRKGRIYDIFGLGNTKGLSNCLLHISDNEEENLKILPEYIYETDTPGLHVMTNGLFPPNPSELLSSEKMKILLNIVHEVYDIIILDGTPCNLVSDSIVLSSIVDTTILVCESKKTKITDMKKVASNIELVNGSISGVILNKKKVAAKTYKNGYYASMDGVNQEKVYEDISSKIIQVEELIRTYKAKKEKQLETIQDEDVNLEAKQEVSEDGKKLLKKSTIDQKSLELIQKDNLLLKKDQEKILEELTILNNKIEKEENQDINNELADQILAHTNKVQELANQISEIEAGQTKFNVDNKTGQLKIIEQIEALKSIENQNEYLIDEIENIKEQMMVLKYDKTLEDIKSSVDDLKQDNIQVTEKLEKLSSQVKIYKSKNSNILDFNEIRRDKDQEYGEIEIPMYGEINFDELELYATYICEIPNEQKMTVNMN